MELIDREELLKDLKTSAIYHANNSREETLMYRDRNIVREQPTVEAIPKADYENRLKADMVAMLEDLDLKIDEMYEPQFSKEGMDGFYWAQGLFKALVQEEINVLKENEDGKRKNM